MNSGRVIKAGASARRVEAPLYDARREAERLLLEARAEAERALAQARGDAERLRAEATALGRERGLASATELLVHARSQAARAQAAEAAALRTLAVRIAERILGRELALRPDAIADVCGEALALAGQRRELVVRAHPNDLEALERSRPRLLEQARQARALSFRPDESVGRGGCVIETGLGRVDARLSVQLEAIERALRGDDE